MQSLRTEIVAELGVNHDGSTDRAIALVDAAVEAGADCVKLQTFKAERMVTKTAPKATYQQSETQRGQSQFEMLEALELSAEGHIAVQEHALFSGIELLSTPFDGESADFLIQELRLERIKVGSGELTNGPLLHRVARSGLPIVLSTGMGTLEEVEQALAVIAHAYLEPEQAVSLDACRAALNSAGGQAALREKVTLLHCTSAYPAPVEDVNLRAMDTLEDSFHLAVGFSDHTMGIEAPIAAVARGAVMIEKHLTLDRSAPGPDHSASLDPEMFATMVASIRNVERLLGTGVKAPSRTEIETARVVRKSLVAATAIEVGERLTSENLAIKRPGIGLSPMRYWEWLGRPAERDYEPEDLIK